MTTNKVFVVVYTIVDCFAETDTFVSKVLSTMDKAKSRLREEIEIQMESFKESQAEYWDDIKEDENFDTFEEYWEDYLHSFMESDTRFVYHDDDGIVIEIAILESDFE